jgi:DNA-binding NarL/FixJ family response regulator
VRVVIAEDNVLLREGISALLRDDSIDVVAAVPDAVQLISAVDALQPDLAIVDVRMPADAHRRRPARRAGDPLPLA